VRARLERLLAIPPHRTEPRAIDTIASRTIRDCRLETLVITGADGTSIPALFTAPSDLPGPFPAILYLHAHGNRYEIGKRELVDGRPSLQSPPYGEALARAGFAALCLDMPTFGERSGVQESELAKRLLWQGRTLFGAMLQDLQVGLDVLSSRSDVDPARIGAMGLSMGATHAFWLAALDDRVRAIAHLCCFADLDWLVRHGAHDLHGIYMMVPGLVAELSTGEIAASLAPRPQLCCVGLADPLTPPPAVEIAGATVAEAYRQARAEDRWMLHADPEGGHRETSQMRALVLDHFKRHLGTPHAQT
jgi:acetyl esterase/lipase